MSSTSPSGMRTASHHTSAAVWAATAVIMAGSIVDAVALIEWIWPLFWLGVGLMVLGSLAAKAANIMDAVSEFGRMTPPADSDYGGSPT